MKRFNKLQALLLAFALVVSTLANGFIARAETDTDAAASITVTLRIEQDEATMAPPVQIQLTEADKRDFGVGLPTDMWTPLHALAKYMIEYAGATEETLTKYLYLYLNESDGSIYINDISTAGNCGDTYADANKNAAANGQAGVYWMYTVNNGVSYYYANQYSLKNNDSIVFYGLWGGLYDENWNPLIPGYYTAFNKTEYEVWAGKPCEVVLNSYETDDPEEFHPVSGASIIVGTYSEQTPSVTKESAIPEYTTVTNDKGTASLTLKEPGTYVLSAYREVKQGDTINYDISRPYALVTVKKSEEKTDNAGTGQSNTNAETNTNTNTKTDVGTVTPFQNNTAKMPGKVTKLKASVKKSKKKKKSVKLTWKKTTNATAYQIYISKSKKKGYKKQATLKGKSKTIKLTAGTYYIKVRAYNKSGAFYKYGKFSDVVKVKVKKK